MKRLSLTKEKNEYAISNDACKKREKELCAWGVPLEGLTVTGLLIFFALLLCLTLLTISAKSSRGKGYTAIYNNERIRCAEKVNGFPFLKETTGRGESILEPSISAKRSILLGNFCWRQQLRVTFCPEYISMAPSQKSEQLVFVSRLLIFPYFPQNRMRPLKRIKK